MSLQDNAKNMKSQTRRKVSSHGSDVGSGLQLKKFTYAQIQEKVAERWQIPEYYDILMEAAVKEDDDGVHFNLKHQSFKKLVQLVKQYEDKHVQEQQDQQQQFNQEKEKEKRGKQKKHKQKQKQKSKQKSKQRQKMKHKDRQTIQDGDEQDDQSSHGSRGLHRRKSTPQQHRAPTISDFVSVGSSQAPPLPTAKPPKNILRNKRMNNADSLSPVKVLRTKKSTKIRSHQEWLVCYLVIVIVVVVVVCGVFEYCCYIGI